MIKFYPVLLYERALRIQIFVKYFIKNLIITILVYLRKWKLYIEHIQIMWHSEISR